MTGCCYDGFNDFKWIIDETLYGQPRLLPEEKIEWVCKNFEHTQKYLEDTKNK